MWYVSKTEYYSAIKNEMISFIATGMDPKIVILSEVSQRKTSIIWYHLFEESKKFYKWTYLENGNRFTDIENKLMVTKEDEGERYIRGLGLMHVYYYV